MCPTNESCVTPAGTCGGSCGPTQTQCSGNAPQTCVNGAWVSGTACTGGTPVCSAGACYVCAPDSTQCLNTTTQQTCASNGGSWGSNVTCAYSCQSGACVGPECQLTPTSGITTCAVGQDCCGNPSNYTATCEAKGTDGGACPTSGGALDCAGQKGTDGGYEVGECSSGQVCCGKLVLTGGGSAPNCTASSLTSSCMTTAQCGTEGAPGGCGGGTYTVHLCTSKADCAGLASGDTNCCSCGSISGNQNPVHMCISGLASFLCGHCL
jgi:hypothetical protein